MSIRYQALFLVEALLAQNTWVAPLELQLPEKAAEPRPGRLKLGVRWGT